MNNYNNLITKKKIPQLFVFGMYRSGTTVIARTLAGEQKIAFAADPIRPFFNCYRTALQKKINLIDFEDETRPLGDYFNGNKNYIKKLLNSNFSETLSSPNIIDIRKRIIKAGISYSPKFINNLKKFQDLTPHNFADEFKNYITLIMQTYGNSETSLIGLKEVWSIEMAFPIINMIGKNAKIIVIFRNPLDIVASSVSGSANYSILSLARQWRKQIVFFNLIKKMYPNQVTSINYEDFCFHPEEILRKKINFLTQQDHNKFFEELNPVADNGSLWLKNSSYLKEKKSKKIDTASINMYSKMLNESEIEWIRYLTFMNSYTKYNHNKTMPARPLTKFPKRNNSKVDKWAKYDMIRLEENDLDQELQYEHNRFLKPEEKIFSEDSKVNIKYITNQI
jgi:hypothetical protein